MHFILPVGKMHSTTKTVATAPECFVYLPVEPPRSEMNALRHAPGMTAPSFWNYRETRKPWGPCPVVATQTRIVARAWQLWFN
jgi:hypothetical protein